MEYLLDTDHWSYMMRGASAVARRFDELTEKQTLLMSVITMGELLAGVEHLREGKRKRELREKVDRVLIRSEPIVLVEPETARAYSHTLNVLRSIGRPIPTNDIWIAAAARVRDATLVTNDDHFRHVPGLRVESWVR